MARWRLLTPHYLNVLGTKWEYVEVDRITGRQVRKVYQVPAYLNPEDPADWTDRANGHVVVCHKGKGQPADREFVGEPTPDMEPMDDEAKAISAAIGKTWQIPATAEMPEKGYGEVIVNELTRRIGEIAVSAGNQNQSVAPEAFLALQKQVSDIVEQNAQLLQILAATLAKPVAEPEPKAARRA